MGNYLNLKYMPQQKPKTTISKALFVETIKCLKKQWAHDDKATQALEKIFDAGSFSGYKTHYVTNQLIKILQVAMNDDNADSWIEYFVFDLDFGKKYTVGCANNKDGSNIDLSHAGKLWDFLNKEKE